MLTSQNQEAQSSANGRLVLKPINPQGLMALVFTGNKYHLERPNKLSPINTTGTFLGAMIGCIIDIGKKLQSNIALVDNPKYLDKLSANIHINSAKGDYFTYKTGVDRLCEVLFVESGLDDEGNDGRVKSIIITLNQELIDVDTGMPGEGSFLPMHHLIDFCLSRALTKILTDLSGNSSSLSDPHSILSSNNDQLIEGLFTQGWRF